MRQINLAIAERARAGLLLTAAEIDELATVDLLSLGMLADEVRRARVGDTVTYVRVHEMSPGDDPPPPGAGEVRLGALPETLEAAIAVVRQARALADGRLLTGFSLADVVERADGGWGTRVNVLQHLRDAGLDAIAYAPVDRLSDAPSVLVASAECGLPIRCLAVQRPLGQARTDVLIRMRTLASEFPGVQTAAPLPREQSVALPTTGYDDVRSVALARLAVPTLPHIQVDWAQYGPKLAQVALTFGADDLDRVSAVDDESVGRRRMAAEDVRRNIAAAGFRPVERDARA